jgi:hypothetical protein
MIIMDDAALLKAAYNRLDPLKPLEANSNWYEPIYEKKATGMSAIKKLAREIEWTSNEALYLFSGFIGAGKTTELKRLQADLEQKGCFVIFCDIAEYLNLNVPLDITDLLIVLAGAFGEALEKDKRIGKSVLKESYWDRLRTFLKKTTVEKVGIGFDLEGVSIQGELRENPSFRNVIRDRLANHLSNFKKDIDVFFEDCVKLIESKTQKGMKVVFIIDSLEKLQGTLSNEKEVIASMEMVFGTHKNKLRLPYVQTVYAVPPWLKFVQPDHDDLMYILHSVQQWQNNAARDRNGIDGDQRLLALLKRRFSPDEFTRLFHDDERTLKLIEKCGGHFRDLFIMARTAMLDAETLPLTEKNIERGIISLRNAFLPLSIEDAQWLDRIAKDRHPAHGTEADGNHLARFLNLHTVLYFSNGEEWYDIHPLVREEVAGIVKRNPDHPKPS